MRRKVSVPALIATIVFVILQIGFVVFYQLSGVNERSQASDLLWQNLKKAEMPTNQRSVVAQAINDAESRAKSHTDNLIFALMIVNVPLIFSAAQLAASCGRYKD